MGEEISGSVRSPPSLSSRRGYALDNRDHARGLGIKKEERL